MKYSDKFKFYIALLAEMLCFPVLISYNYYKWMFGQTSLNEYKVKLRKPIENTKLLINIHEWGGYNAVRTKKVSKISEFECGLQFQLQRFNNYKGSKELDIYLTISDAELLSYSINIKEDRIIKVPNEGMDFSGYGAFFNHIKDWDNGYVILTNSSVNSIQDEVIDSYVDYMNANPDVGLLGVSYSTKIYQSLIRNNFNPHLQSFFLMTTVSVLNDIVTQNNCFPGSGIADKLQLIRQGEVKISQIVLNLGYQLACVAEDGFVFKFNAYCMKDNGRRSWPHPHGDYRTHAKHPNRLNPITKACFTV